MGRATEESWLDSPQGQQVPISAVGPTQSLLQCVLGTVSSEVKRQKREADLSPDLLPELWMSEAISPRLHMPLWHTPDVVTAPLHRPHSGCRRYPAVRHISMYVSEEPAVSVFVVERQKVKQQPCAKRRYVSTFHGVMWNVRVIFLLAFRFCKI